MLDFPPPPERTDGEASNPGPVTWVALNCTSARRQFHRIMALGADVICLTEVRLTGRDQSQYKEFFKEKGYSVLWGAPRPRNQFNGPVKAGGVAILTKDESGIVCRAAPIDTPEEKQFYDCGRLLHGIIGMPSGQCVHAI